MDLQTTDQDRDALTRLAASWADGDVIGGVQIGRALNNIPKLVGDIETLQNQVNVWTEVAEGRANEIKDLRESLDHAVSLVPNFWCPECQADCHRVDEDGCCLGCGADPLTPVQRVCHELGDRIACALEAEADRCDGSTCHENQVGVQVHREAAKRVRAIVREYIEVHA